MQDNGVGEEVGEADGARDGALVGASVGVGVSHWPSTQNVLRQSNPTEHCWPASQGKHSTPPQSTSVSSTFQIPSLHVDGDGAAVGAFVGAYVGGGVGAGIAMIAVASCALATLAVLVRASQHAAIPTSAQFLRIPNGASDRLAEPLISETDSDG